jgi:hypothetical protein
MFIAKRSKSTRDQHIAIRPPGQQAVLDARRSPQSLDKKQPADQKNQDDDHRREARSLPFGTLAARPILQPMVMSIQRTLHRSAVHF